MEAARRESCSRRRATSRRAIWRGAAPTRWRRRGARARDEEGGEDDEEARGRAPAPSSELAFRTGCRRRRRARGATAKGGDARRVRGADGRAARRRDREGDGTRGGGAEERGGACAADSSRRSRPTRDVTSMSFHRAPPQHAGVTNGAHAAAQEGEAAHVLAAQVGRCFSAQLCLRCARRRWRSRRRPPTSDKLARSSTRRRTESLGASRDFDAAMRLLRTRARAAPLAPPRELREEPPRCDDGRAPSATPRGAARRRSMLSAAGPFPADLLQTLIAFGHRARRRRHRADEGEGRALQQPRGEAPIVVDA